MIWLPVFFPWTPPIWLVELCPPYPTVNPKQLVSTTLAEAFSACVSDRKTSGAWILQLLSDWLAFKSSGPFRHCFLLWSGYFYVFGCLLFLHLMECRSQLINSFSITPSLTFPSRFDFTIRKTPLASCKLMLTPVSALHRFVLLGFLLTSFDLCVWLISGRHHGNIQSCLLL